jgi:hypothetical protein
LRYEDDSDNVEVDVVGILDVVDLDLHG